MSKRWRIRPHDSDQLARLEKMAGVPPVVAQLLLNRGITDEKAIRQFLEAPMLDLHDPELLPGIQDAADLVMATIAAGKRITVYGDYDADGMTGTAILLRCLSMLQADAGSYLSNRMSEGYGLNSERLEKLAGEGTSLVISVDCGIGNVAEAARARELGLELIITDHHRFGETLPEANVLVHPALPGSSYPFAGLCGAGVAFKLAWALCQRASDARKVSPAMREFLLLAMGLAAIGTVADVVPLLDENRIIVRHGLVSMREHAPLGLKALMRRTKLEQKSSLDADDIGFTIGPRLNAAGRLGQAELGVELLTTDNPQRAEDLAEYLDELNESRKTLERSISLAANKQIKEDYDAENDDAFVLAGRGWHPGVIGIVASRIAEKFQRPTIIIAQDKIAREPAVGSGRSALGLDLYEALNACTDHLVKHGGHPAAAGLTIEDRNIDAFRSAFCEHVAESICEEDLVAEVMIDAETTLSQLTLQVVEQIHQLAPFGNSNPRPVLCAAGVEIAGRPSRMGGGDVHLSVKLKQHSVTLRAVAFGKGDWAEEMDQVEGNIDIAYRAVINEFRGQRNVELHLVDWRPAETTAAVPVESS
jgi:single-stranded-DNA-specific exonuclease